MSVYDIMNEILADIESDPKPATADDLNGIIDSRSYELGQVMKKHPETAYDVFKGLKSNHLKAQMLFAANKMRTHVHSIYVFASGSGSNLNDMAEYWSCRGL